MFLSPMSKPGKRQLHGVRRFTGFAGVLLVKSAEVSRNAALKLCRLCCDPLGVHHPLAACGGLELRTIQRYQSRLKQASLAQRTLQSYGTLQ